MQKNRNMEHGACRGMKTWNMDHADEWKHGIWIMQMNRNMDYADE